LSRLDGIELVVSVTEHAEGIKIHSACCGATLLPCHNIQKTLLVHLNVIELNLSTLYFLEVRMPFALGGQPNFLE
jgi:hypothetical protein